MANKKATKKTTNQIKTYPITFQVKKKETHAEYRRLSKAMQGRGFDIGRVIPEFLIAQLQTEESDGFEGLKKFI